MNMIGAQCRHFDMLGGKIRLGSEIPQNEEI
jgi:hypothetical protein